jgi:hypothetical protein
MVVADANFRRRSETTIGSGLVLAPAVPQRAKKGDAVAVYQGGRVPVILRIDDNDGCRRVIGECYMHGIMDREAWTGFEADDIILK